jgi:hypothetical protein
MKKTIIAAALSAAVAAPAAMADVSISGNVVSDFITNWKGNDLGSANAVDVVFKASEDLGNGMKASAKVHMLEDNGSDGNADATVTLSGDFGALTVGRMEPFIEGAVVSQATFDASDALSIENAQKSSKRSEGSIAYTNSMGAVSFGVAAIANGGTDNNFTGKTAMVKFSAGGLTVTAAMEDLEAADSDTNAIAVAYKMGDMTVKVVHQDAEAADSDDTVYGMTYKMGNNTFGVGFKDSDAADSDDAIVSVKHSMSKNVWVGLTHKSVDATGADDQTAVTVGMKF